MNGHQHDGVGVLVIVIHVADQGNLFQKANKPSVGIVLLIALGGGEQLLNVFPSILVFLAQKGQKIARFIQNLVEDLGRGMPVGKFLKHFDQPYEGREFGITPLQFLKFGASL